ITAHFYNKPIEFDFILLGLGDDAHTASLFPDTEVLKESEATIKSVFVEQVGMDRITMTAPLINQAQNIAFLVFVKNKSEAVYRVLNNTEGETAMLRTRLIKSNKKKVVWYLDTADDSKL